MGTSWWPEHARDRALFVSWTAVGALAGFGILALLSIGGFLLVGATLAAIVLLSVIGPHRATFGVLVGLGAAAAALAWLNRSGPGVVCTRDADAQSCVEQWSPWPWLAAAVALVALGVTGYRRRHPRQDHRPRLGAIVDPQR